LKHMIGNTPLLAVRFAFRGQERVIYAKAEHLNMTGRHQGPDGLSHSKAGLSGKSYSTRRHDC
jgi:hypothetical protein